MTIIMSASKDHMGTHILVTHRKVPGHLYSAAGDRYLETYDYGKTSKRSEAGLENHGYLAVDSSDSTNIVVSASKTAQQAHSHTDPKKQCDCLLH